MTQPPIIEPRRLSPSGPFLPPGGGACVLQMCSDSERSDQIRLRAAPGSNWFLQPRAQAVDDNPIRCAFVAWTAGSFLKVSARLAFNVIASAATPPIQFAGSSRIAIDVGAGFQQARRTGSGFAEGITSVAGTNHIQTGTAAHDHLLGPFDVPPVVALASLWSITTGAHMITGPEATSAAAFNPFPMGVSLVCAEVSAECVIAAQPPELITVALVDPNFAA